LEEINIVMVEPEIPQNTGNISRTCAAIGAKLHLVKPLGFEIDDKKLKRAGLDYWHMLDITYYEGLNDFFIKTKAEQNTCFYFSTKARFNYSEISYPDKVYLFFGKETKGLPETLLMQHPETCVRIPMLDGARSLNLSNSVAIAAYEVLRQHNFAGLKCEGQLHHYRWF